MSRISRGVTLALVVLVAAACGSGDGGIADKSASEIFAAAKKATAAAESVHVAGTLDEGDEHFQLDISIDENGGSGTIGLGGESTLAFRRAGDDLYVRGPTEAWVGLSADSAAAQRFADKWIKTTADDESFKDLASLFDVDTFMRGVEPEGKIRKGKETTFGGQDAIELLDDTSTLYVATSGPARVLGFAGSGKQSGKVVFDRYDEADVEGPPAASVDLDELVGD